VDEREQLEYMEELIEVEVLDRKKFLQVRETLTRIGIKSKSSNDMWQSCHVLQKRGRYFIVHFKQLFVLEGKATREDISQQDIDRLEQTVIMLEKWGLVKPLVELDYDVKVKLDIIPYKQKSLFNLKSKHRLGKDNERSEHEPGRRFWNC